MITKEEIINLIGFFISVGVPNFDFPDQLFFYYGVLKEVTDTTLKLETRAGVKIVPLAKVMDVHITRREK